jgi:hypothetical protein
MAVNKMNRLAPSANSTANYNAGGGSQNDPVILPGNNISLKLTCGKKDTITLKCKTTYNFTASYICSKPQCGSTSIVVTTPGGSTTNYTNSASFTTNDSGYYTVNIYGKCGNKICDSCKFVFKVICPVCPCEYKLGVQPGKNSQVVMNTNPKYTLYNQAFAITAPTGALFTQVRAEVVSFDLTSSFNNECISCKNSPYTWGSIYNASDINTNAAVADSITMGPNPPVTQFTPSLANIHQNPRETIWGNYSGFTLPSTLNMQFVLPHPSVIGCCTLYARTCVKFTFRDRNCKECEVISCFTVTIPPPSQNGDIPVDKVQQDLKGQIPAGNADCETCGTSPAGQNANGNLPESVSAKKQGTSDTEMQPTDEEVLKNIEQKIVELKKLKDQGVKRGDVEMLPRLESDLILLKEKGKPKK